MLLREYALGILGMICLQASAAAATYVVPLPVEGDYAEPGNARRSFQIDLNTSLASIQEIRFHCIGSVRAGQYFFGSPSGVFSSLFSAFITPSPNSILWAQGPYVGAATFPAAESFESEITFRTAYGTSPPTFLLDGRAEGRVQLGPDAYGELGPAVYPTGHIDAAWIVIEATPVPEPTMVGLSLFGLLVCGRRGWR
jgi:hypothetical protein